MTSESVTPGMPWRVMVVSLSLIACHSGSADTTNACDFDGGACSASDDELKSCVGLTTGIYGAAFTSCVGSGAPLCSSCSTGAGASLTITSSTGVVAAAVFGDGYYSVALQPGTYSVCCNLDNGGYPEAGANFDCVSETLVAGDVVRLDDSLTESAGGDQCDLHAP